MFEPTVTVFVARREADLEQTPLRAHVTSGYRYSDSKQDGVVRICDWPQCRNVSGGMCTFQPVRGLTPQASQLRRTYPIHRLCSSSFFQAAYKE